MLSQQILYSMYDLLRHVKLACTAIIAGQGSSGTADATAVSVAVAKATATAIANAVANASNSKA